MEIVKLVNFSYAGYFFIGRTSTSSSRNITYHKLSLACKLTLFLLLLLRKTSQNFARLRGGTRMAYGGRASELFGRNSFPNKSGKCTKAKRMIFSYESVAISKTHTFRLWSRITASEWKRTTTLAILIHRSGWHFDCPLGGLLFPSPGWLLFTCYQLQATSY